MLKLYYVIIIFAVFACKKPEPVVVSTPENTSMISGLPKYHKALHGYCYSLYLQNQTGTEDGMVLLHAAFADPAKSLLDNFEHFGGSGSLLGNIHLGKLRFNDSLFLPSTVIANEKINYKLDYTSKESRLKETPVWLWEGNVPIRGERVEVTRGYPIINKTIMTPIQRNASYELDLRHISNYDSGNVYITSLNEGKRNSKDFSAADKIELTMEDLKGYQSEPGLIIFFTAYNYSYKYIDSRLYLFELGCRRSETVAITP